MECQQTQRWKLTASWSWRKDDLEWKEMREIEAAFMKWRLMSVEGLTISTNLSCTKATNERCLTSKQRTLKGIVAVIIFDFFSFSSIINNGSMNLYDKCTVRGRLIGERMRAAKWWQFKSTIPRDENPSYRLSVMRSTWDVNNCRRIPEIHSTVLSSY